MQVDVVAYSLCKEAMERELLVGVAFGCEATICLAMIVALIFTFFPMKKK